MTGTSGLFGLSLTVITGEMREWLFVYAAGFLASMTVAPLILILLNHKVGKCAFCKHGFAMHEDSKGNALRQCLREKCECLGFISHKTYS